jgi:hypothetical protein
MKGSMEKQKNKGGRPLIELTDEQVEKVTELAAYLNCEQIADYFDMGESTFYELKNRDSRVSGAYKKGKAYKIYDYAKKLENKAMGVDEHGDTGAIIFYLKTQAGWATESKNDNKLKIPLGNKSALEILNGGLTALEQGEINISEAQQIGNLALTKMNIEKDNPMLEDKELKITIEVKEHENLDKLSPEQIQRLKDKGSL